MCAIYEECVIVTTPLLSIKFNTKQNNLSFFLKYHFYYMEKNERWNHL